MTTTKILNYILSSDWDVAIATEYCRLLSQSQIKKLIKKLEIESTNDQTAYNVLGNLYSWIV